MKINGDFDELIDIINESSNEELESKLESFEPNLKNFEFEYWVDEIFNKDIDRIDINKMPQVLDIFCRSFDRFKFMLFCMMLEATIERVPYLTNLENIPLCEEKWEMLKHTVSVIIRNVGNQIVNCMFLLLINNDPEGRYLTDEEKENIIYGINANLNAINRYLEKMEASKIDISIFMTLELVIDAACYIHDDDTTKKIEELLKKDMPDSVIIFTTKYQIINNMPYIDKHIKRLLDNEERKYAFLKTLDELGRLDLVMPYIDQDIIATSRMIDWLIYPTELGKMPTDIAIAGKIEKNNLIYYAFKFKTDIERLKDREYMVGVCGGYEKGKVTTMDSGIVFSKFDKADDDIINKAEELIDEIISYWQNRQYNN